MSEDRPRILLDVDGVLCDFLGPCLKLINQIGRTSHTLDQMSTWNIFESLGVPKNVEKLVYEAMHSPEWCRKLPVLPQADEIVQVCRDEGDLVIVTSPMHSPTWMHERERWLRHHFGDVEVIHTSVKHYVAGDFLIDDKTETLINWQRCHPHGHAIRWKAVTNLTTPFDGPTVDRVSDLHHYLVRAEFPDERHWLR